MSLSDLEEVLPQPLESLQDDRPSLPIPEEKVPWLRKVIASLAQVQKYSAYGFLVFVGLHISSTVVAPGLGVNAEKCQHLFEMTRAVYLAPLFETPFIYGTALLHAFSGTSIRALRSFTAPERAPPQKEIIIQDGQRDDIGLGGIATVLGLGFKKSWISSHFPALTPLTLSGYVMAVFLGYHVYKMKWSPVMVDGDSSLVTLQFITHYLHQSNYGRLGALFNQAALGFLSWVSFYHMVSGLFKYRRQFSLRAKKIAYGVISVFTGLSLIAMTRFKSWDLDHGFMGKQFAKYLLR